MATFTTTLKIVLYHFYWYFTGTSHALLSLTAKSN